MSFVWHSIAVAKKKYSDNIEIETNKQQTHGKMYATFSRRFSICTTLRLLKKHLVLTWKYDKNEKSRQKWNVSKLQQQQQRQQ